MSRLFRAGTVPALILAGALAGCGGNADDPGAGAGDMPVAEPGQTAIPDADPAGGSGDAGGGTAEVPVEDSPAEPGTSP